MATGLGLLGGGVDSDSLDVGLGLGMRGEGCSDLGFESDGF